MASTCAVSEDVDGIEREEEQILANGEVFSLTLSPLFHFSLLVRVTVACLVTPLYTYS